jgi:hypothetical protein
MIKKRLKTLAYRVFGAFMGGGQTEKITGGGITEARTICCKQRNREYDIL